MLPLSYSFFELVGWGGEGGGDLRGGGGDVVGVGVAGDCCIVWGGGDDGNGGGGGIRGRYTAVHAALWVMCLCHLLPCFLFVLFGLFFFRFERDTRLGLRLFRPQV